MQRADTVLETVFVAETDGRVRRIQIALVECDSGFTTGRSTRGALRRAATDTAAAVVAPAELVAVAVFGEVQELARRDKEGRHATRRRRGKRGRASATR